MLAVWLDKALSSVLVLWDLAGKCQQALLIGRDLNWDMACQSPKDFALLFNEVKFRSDALVVYWWLPLCF